MISPQANYSLRDLNTFGIDAKAHLFYKVDTVEELKIAITELKQSTLEILVLGGGSNILFTKDYAGGIIQPNILGVETIDFTDDFELIRVGAGVEWDSLVEFTVAKGLGGIENLSLIPGTVGASPIQNIGAYGVEVKDCIQNVEGIFIDSLSAFNFSASECQFGYRDSIFKNELKGKVVVTYVTFKLSKSPTLITHYGNLDSEINYLGGLSLQNVRQAVINIRNSKLPNPKDMGNAGSFFKNPMVDIQVVENLQKTFEKVPFYPVNDKQVKLPAGWLIEQSGWKGKRHGNVGVHKDQALVLVNLGGGNGEEVLELAQKVQSDVLSQFGVKLEMEVNVF
jgi:UDP-N-acetylmuramate dehydrogenase